MIRFINIVSKSVVFNSLKLTCNQSNLFSSFVNFIFESDIFFQLYSVELSFIPNKSTSLSRIFQKNKDELRLSRKFYIFKYPYGMELQQSERVVNKYIGKLKLSNKSNNLSFKIKPCTKSPKSIEHRTSVVFALLAIFN